MLDKQHSDDLPADRNHAINAAATRLPWRQRVSLLWKQNASQNRTKGHRWNTRDEEGQEEDKEEDKAGRKKT